MVISLNASNVEEHINTLKSLILTGNALVFVHAHWCPYTVSFYGTWRRLKAKLIGLTNLTVIEIDDEALMKLRVKHTNTYKKLADFIQQERQYKIYFPTIMLYVDGVRYKYDEERTVENLTEFVHENIFGERSSRRRRPSKGGKLQPSTKKAAPKKDTLKKDTPKKATMKTQKKPSKSLQQEIDDAFKRLLLM
jgi:hypothetical protein